MIISPSSSECRGGAADKIDVVHSRTRFVGIDSIEKRVFTDDKPVRRKRIRSSYVALGKASDASLSRKKPKSPRKRFRNKLLYGMPKEDDPLQQVRQGPTNSTSQRRKEAELVFKKLNATTVKQYGDVLYFIDTPTQVLSFVDYGVSESFADYGEEMSAAAQKSIDELELSMWGRFKRAIRTPSTPDASLPSKRVFKSNLEDSVPVSFWGRGAQCIVYLFNLLLSILKWLIFDDWVLKLSLIAILGIGVPLLGTFVYPTILWARGVNPHSARLAAEEFDHVREWFGFEPHVYYSTIPVPLLGMCGLDKRTCYWDDDISHHPHIRVTAPEIIQRLQYGGMLFRHRSTRKLKFGVKVVDDLLNTMDVQFNWRWYVKSLYGMVAAFYSFLAGREYYQAVMAGFSLILVFAVYSGIAIYAIPITIWALLGLLTESVANVILGLFALHKIWSLFNFIRASHAQSLGTIAETSCTMDDFNQNRDHTLGWVGIWDWGFDMIYPPWLWKPAVCYHRQIPAAMRIGARIWFELTHGQAQLVALRLGGKQFVEGHLDYRGRVTLLYDATDEINQERPAPILEELGCGVNNPCKCGLGSGLEATQIGWCCAARIPQHCNRSCKNNIANCICGRISMIVAHEPQPEASKEFNDSVPHMLRLLFGKNFKRRYIGSLADFLERWRTKGDMKGYIKHYYGLMDCDYIRGGKNSEERMMFKIEAVASSFLKVENLLKKGGKIIDFRGIQAFSAMFNMIIGRECMMFGDILAKMFPVDEVPKEYEPAGGWAMKTDLIKTRTLSGFKLGAERINGKPLDTILEEKLEVKAGEEDEYHRGDTLSCDEDDEIEIEDQDGPVSDLKACCGTFTYATKSSVNAIGYMYGKHIRFLRSRWSSSKYGEVVCLVIDYKRWDAHVTKVLLDAALDALLFTVEPGVDFKKWFELLYETKGRFKSAGVRYETKEAEVKSGVIFTSQGNTIMQALITLWAVKEILGVDWKIAADCFRAILLGDDACITIPKVYAEKLMKDDALAKKLQSLGMHPEIDYVDLAHGEFCSSYFAPFLAANGEVSYTLVPKPGRVMAKTMWTTHPVKPNKAKRLAFGISATMIERMWIIPFMRPWLMMPITKVHEARKKAWHTRDSKERALTAKFKPKEIGVLDHKFWSGRAINPDDVTYEWFEKIWGISRANMDYFTRLLWTVKRELAVVSSPFITRVLIVDTNMQQGKSHPVHYNRTQREVDAYNEARLEARRERLEEIARKEAEEEMLKEQEERISREHNEWMSSLGATAGVSKPGAFKGDGKTRKFK